jgi:ribose transport system permease protein
MNRTLSRLLTDYGMIFVLAILCAFFTVATYTEQSPTAEAAARQIAGLIKEQFGAGRKVLIVAGDRADETQFADKLAALLADSGAKALDTVKGEPKDARAALLKIVAAGQSLDAIVCTRTTASWLVFADLKTDFPKLGVPQLIQPRTEKWPNFLKSENLVNIANQIAGIAIIAIGMTMVIITGGIDLSVGSLLALSAVLAARFIRDFGGAEQASAAGMTVACITAILVCGLIGWFSGGLITLCDLPPFIVTLSMMLICSGLAYQVADGQSIYQLPDSFIWLGRGEGFFGIPNAVLLMMILYVAAHVLMSRMRLGRHLYAVGGNREAARLSGVPVRRVVMFAYVASAMLAGLGGVIMTSQLKSGSPTYGNIYEMYVIAAVVVGGTSLSGGEGKMFGTLIGAFTIAVIQNGMNLTNVESMMQRVVLGGVILSAALLDKLRHRLWRGGSAHGGS